MDLLSELLSELTAEKRQLDAEQPLSPAVLDELREALDVEWTYHSNAIEGNTLTLRETALVLKDGLAVGGKTLREHLEAINHQHAIHFVQDLVAQDQPITEHTIRNLHALILRTINDDQAGRYRSVEVRITGSDFATPGGCRAGTHGRLDRLVERSPGSRATFGRAGGAGPFSPGPRPPIRGRKRAHCALADESVVDASRLSTRYRPGARAPRLLRCAGSRLRGRHRTIYPLNRSGYPPVSKDVAGGSGE